MPVKKIRVDPSRLPSLEAVTLELSRRECSQSFAEFVKQAWHVIEPSTPLLWGWAMDAICEHLEAVTRGDVKRLLMNVPPGMSKSTLVGVMWPAWEWGPCNRPDLRYVSTAHKADLATRDNTKCRRLIQSEWYQKRWSVPLVGDQNAKTKFENKSTGFRESMAFTSMTGTRGDRVILDDPISAHDSNSEAALRSAEIEFTETLPTRVNNDNSAIVVIMQRLHERDTSGLILDRGLPYVHLNLPMRFEPERRCTTSIGFVDPRDKEGELVFPERFAEKQVTELENVMGSFASAGQLQQRPVPRSGGLFELDWFTDKFIDHAPPGTTFVRGWDLAATAKDGAAFTAGVKVGKAPDGRIIIAHTVRGRYSGNGARTVIKTTAQADNCRQSIPQDPGQAGKAQVEQFTQDLQGCDVRFSVETGDKVSRALPISAQAEAGNVYIVKGEWNQAFIDEICTFPNGKYKDQVDGLSRAYSDLLKLTRPKTSKVSAFGASMVSA